MGFTIGDIIVLLVVVVILAVYRQMDRNNRSLEKVKRFVERVQGEMDEIVAEKVTMLKDIGIEVDVHQKAAKEVLKRIQTIEDDLNSRTGSLEEIGTRLSEYENVLNQLVEMTQRTEENIGRVRDESEYVDKVGKRIKAAQGKIDELEHSLPGIVAGFEQQNDERLGELEERFFASSEKRVHELDNRVDGAKARVQEFQEEVVRLSSEVDERARTAQDDLHALHTRLSDDAREEIEAIAAAGRNEFESQREELRAFIEETEQRGVDFRNESEEAVSSLQDALAESTRDAEERLDALAETGRALETEALRRLKEYIAQEQETVKTELNERYVAFERSEQDRVSELERVSQEAHDSISERLDERSASFRDEIVSQLNALTDEVNQTIIATRESLGNDIDHLTTTNRSERRKIEERYGALRNEVDTLSDQTNTTITDLTGKIESLDTSINRKVSEAHTALDAHSGEIDERISKERSRLDEAFQTFRADYDRDRTTIEEVADTLGRSIADLEERLREAAVSSESKISAMEQGLAERVGRSSQDVETRVLGELEKRLYEYETDLNYRFTKIETVNTDIDQLEQQLRLTMDRISERVRADFLSFGEEIRELRDQDRVEAQDGMEKLRTAMGELENGLNELKQRAYENVSEKLQIFEDEFFKDLRARSEAMDAKIVQWRDDVDTRLTTLQDEHLDGRTAIEQKYNEELRSRLYEFQESITNLLNKTDEQIDSFRSGIQSRIDAADEHIEGFETSMTEELESLKERSFQTFRQEFARADTRARDELREFESEVEERIATIRGSVRSGTEELEGMIESSRSDIAVWQTEVLNQLRSSGADVNNQLADAKVRLSENLQELKREYAEEREQLVEASQQERSRLKGEISSLANSVQKLDDRITHVSEEAIDEFEERYRTIRNGIDEHEGAIAERIEDRSVEFRSLIDDTRGQFQAMREKLIGKLEEEARTLETTLGEISKRQRNFVEQTKIFERADSLKEGLEISIEELKGEITRVEGLRGEVRDIEGQFVKIRKMSAETGEKMARFTADKRRIDLLEEDYKRLIGLAQSVEQKIEQVGNSDQQLQEITARLRSLDELQEEVETRFDRMEKRRSYIDKTADSIEANSQNLQAIENRMEELTRQVAAMPKHVEGLAGQLKKVQVARKDTDKAVEQLSKLDQTLADVEARMQELQTAREWLARTETRLEEIRRDAGEQVKLLGSIMREETKKHPVDGGAPSLNARETVQKLAHQGWNVDEIARATKVSKGEVELILELTSNK